MTDIRADVARAGEADLGVHVSAVHVDLSAVLVDDLADFLDRLLKHAVRAGVGDHDAREIFFMLGGFFLEVFQIDVALRIAGDGDDFQARHHCRRRIGAMGGGGDQADVAMGVAA